MNVRDVSIEVVSDGLLLNAGGSAPSNPAGLCILLHGIPSTAPPDPDDEGYPGLARTFASEGFAAVWADMRGVRGSPGYFSIEGWVADARAIVEAARSRAEFGDLPLALVGSSAGGAASAEAVSRGAPVDALVLLAAPAAWVSFAGDAAAGVRRIVEEAGMPLAPETLTDPTAWAAEFESVSTEAAIRDVSVPTLIVHGTADDVVPVDHASRIAGDARNARLEVIEGATHQLRRDDRALKLVLEWLRSTLPIAA